METLSRDVLPSGVHRRLGRRDMRLPVILVGELMAGMALGLVWPQLTAPPLPVPQTAMTAVTVPLPVPVTPAVPGPAVVPLVTHAPRNPFGAPDGIDTSQQAPVAAVPVPAAPPRPVVPPVAGAAPPVPGAPAVPAPAGSAPAAPTQLVPDHDFSDLR